MLFKSMEYCKYIECMSNHNRTFKAKISVVFTTVYTTFSENLAYKYY